MRPGQWAVGVPGGEALRVLGSHARRGAVGPAEDNRHLVRVRIRIRVRVKVRIRVKVRVRVRVRVRVEGEG